jgi:hypothetical protein
LQDQGSYWGGGGLALADVGIARVETAVAESTPAGDGAVSSPVEQVPPVEATTTPVDPMPPVEEPMPPVDGTIPEPEPLVVTLVDVEADVWWTWDEDGSIWLLPAYRFVGDDGGWYTVPAVTDEYLVVVEPQPLPEPVPMPEPMPVETAPTVTPDVPKDQTPDNSVPEDALEPPLFDIALLEPSIGTSLADFTASAESLGATVRVVEQDGESLPGTMDFLPNRVDVAVDGGVVTRIVDVG